MSTFFSNCTAVPDCPVDTQAQCDQIKLSGVFNCTDIKHDTDPATLYCWRLAVENCTNEPVCDFQLKLDPEWKYQSGFNPSVNTIFQVFFSSNELSDTVQISTNIPDAQANTNWTGDLSNSLFELPVTLPAGRWVVEVCVEVSKSDIANLTGSDCYDPALFPALLEASFTNANNTGCPVTITSIVGCNPDSIVVVA